jgi:hypothetical protein
MRKVIAQLPGPVQQRGNLLGGLGERVDERLQGVPAFFPLLEKVAGMPTCLHRSLITISCRNNSLAKASSYGGNGTTPGP